MKLLSLPLALLLGLVMAVPAFGATTAFTGEWIGNDPQPPDGDGSTVHLYISGGTQAKISFIDEFGTICQDAGSPVTTFTSTLVGQVDPDVSNVLVARFVAARCGTVPLQELRGVVAIYALDDKGNADPSDDTLYDGLVTWHRV